MYQAEEGSFIFDDIGSYPLPKGVRPDISQCYLEAVRDVMDQKISAGVEVPTYPQLRDMVRMFMDPIEDPETSDEPYLVRPEAAEIFELEALDSLPPGTPLRVCVTGPVELYLSAFGATAYTDILYRLAESVARFLRRAMEGKPFEVLVASVDEPSLGINPNVAFDEDEIARALETATAPCRGMDCEVHLHSSLYAELCCNVPTINVIGVESAANPDYLKLIDRKLLEETDSYIRAGIARTDILSMAARLNDRLGVNLWSEPKRLEREILAQESPEVMEARLVAAHRIFGSRIRAVGPDCGLGSWPNQEMARQLLFNCSRAVTSFRRSTAVS